MKTFLIALLLSFSTFITGCTTIGQQITNRDGTIQIQQYGTPVSAQSQPNSYASVQPISDFDSNLDQEYFYSYRTGLIALERTDSTKTVTQNTKTNNTSVQTVTTKITTNTVTPVAAPDNQIKNKQNIKNTNNVTVNVYADSVNIKESSILSDAYNYFFKE